MRGERASSSTANKIRRHDLRALLFYGVIFVTFVACVRAAVAFHEAYAVIRVERAADSELIELCASGAARQSSKMRSACLNAQMESAAPIAMKAFMKMVADFGHYASTFVGWPFKAVLAICGFFLLASPIRAIADVLRGVQTIHPSAAHHTIYVLNGDEHCVIDNATMETPHFAGLRRRIMGSREAPLLHLPWAGEQEEAQRKTKWI